MTGSTRRQLEWWRRQRLVVPSGRTQGGQHRYSEADVRRVRLLRLLVSGERIPGNRQPISMRKAARILDPLHAQVEGWLEVARAESAARALEGLRSRTD